MKLKTRLLTLGNVRPRINKIFSLAVIIVISCNQSTFTTATNEHENDDIVADSITMDQRPRDDNTLAYHKETEMKRRSTNLNTLFTDPLWPSMWHLNRGSGLDMNIMEAWNLGYTGKGVVVTIVDDGLEITHPDLIKNYDPLASFDYNDMDSDPTPRYDYFNTNRQGTRCAGIVAAEANNTICGVGIAFEASIGGIRMLNYVGDTDDDKEGKSLSHNPQHIDIYSASWGPTDDGKTLDGPGKLATNALLYGITNGRGGKGSIYVWASGVGGKEGDNCNCDGYANSIWTISVSSASENGQVPWYGEGCSSTLTTTYSSGSDGERQITTTELSESCTSSFKGTSASAPIAAGIVALALEANPKLTWRDIQHIIVRTSRSSNLQAKDWKTNGVGRNVSHFFGYGLMDAGAMVKVARDWVPVPKQISCTVKFPQSDSSLVIERQNKLVLNVSLRPENCPDLLYLEHVQVKLSLTSKGGRGNLHMYLTSPSGTRSTLLTKRRLDYSRIGFKDWPFTSVHCWGENPSGVWSLEIHNDGVVAENLSNAILTAFGTGFGSNFTRIRVEDVEDNGTVVGDSNVNIIYVGPSYWNWIQWLFFIIFVWLLFKFIKSRNKYRKVNKPSSNYITQNELVQIDYKQFK